MAKAKKKTRASKKGTEALKRAAAKRRSAPRCGLCGATKNLTRTQCCGNWICDDEHKYVLFSYARNSCHRNHDRYTLCAIHFHEGHEGDWQECAKCRDAYEPEMYVYYGTNEYNFVKLENPPAYEPTHCAQCNNVINLGYGGFVIIQGKYYCLACKGVDIPNFSP